jgi:hypothetical protein
MYMYLYYMLSASWHGVGIYIGAHHHTAQLTCSIGQSNTVLLYCVGYHNWNYSLVGC